MTAPIVIPATTGQVYPALGSITFGDMKQQVAKVAGVLDDPEMEDLAGEFIREIIDDLNRDQTWMFNLVTSADITTSAGDNTVTVPDDFLSVYSMRKTDAIDYQVTVLRQKTFDSLFPSQIDIAGYPFVLVVKNPFRDGTFELFPSPDAVYTFRLHYFKLISRPTRDDEFIDLPRQYETVVKYGATAMMLATVNQFKASEFWDEKFKYGMHTMKRADEDAGIDDDESLRFINVEEVAARGMNYLNPAARPRAYDLW